MTLPLYHNVGTPELASRGNRGLWYTRFFDRYDLDGKISDKGKADWVSSNARISGEPEALKAQALRQLSLVEALAGQAGVFASDWHFATGLGLPHPVENGLTWHPTLGVPYLTGAGVKGLVRAWVEQWEDSFGDSTRAQRLLDWFGSEDPQKPEQFRAGRFIFFDALPVEPVRLAADIMTPHQGKWYEQGGEIRRVAAEPEKVPADWHDPVPVSFLVAREIKLLFTIAPRRPGDAADLPAVFQALEAALDWLGAGAKTAVGYGHMTAQPEALEGLREQQVAARRQAEKAGMSEAQRKLLELQEVFEAAQAAGLKEPGGPLGQGVGELLKQAADWSASERAALADLAEAIYRYLGWTRRMKEKKPLIEQLRQGGEKSS